MSESYMTPAERRDKARKIRVLTEVYELGTLPKTLAEAAAIQEISRMHAYRILEELHAWEEKATFKEMEADGAAQLRSLITNYTTRDVINWASE